MVNFVSFGTDNCEELLDYFYKLLVSKCKEEFTLHYYSVNYESSIKGNNLITYELNTNKKFKRGDRHVSSSTKSEFNPVFLKPIVLIKSLIDIKSDNFIYLDLDTVLTKNFNSTILFDRIKNSNTPLSPQHFWEYPMDYRDPNNIKCFGGDLCIELSIERSGKLWSQNCMIVYSKKHLDFLLDWNKMTNDDKLRNMATGDEEIYNVTLWSYDQNDNLGTTCISNGVVDIRRVGNSRFEDIIECYDRYNNNSFDKSLFVAQNKHTREMTDKSVMIFHGVSIQDFKLLDTKTRVFHVIPWNSDKNIGKSYNETMSLVNDDDWVCFLDGDAVHTTPFFGKRIEDVIKANPQYSLFTCQTNRIGCQYHIPKDVDRLNNDQLYHRNFGEKLWLENQTQVDDITNSQPLSGVLILIKKSTWLKVGKFKEEKMLTIDNDIHYKVRDFGHKVGIMRGIYVQHWYRGGTGDTSHLE
jgi:hypothetical protein